MLFRSDDYLNLFILLNNHLRRILIRTVIVGTSYDLDLSMMLAPAMDSVAAAKPSEEYADSE
mgnify:CR=1 FL=1